MNATQRTAQRKAKKRYADILESDRLTPAMKRKAIAAIANINQTQLAAELGVTRQAIGQIIRGDARSDRLERAFADAVGLPHGALFDEPTRAPQGSNA
jgi:DNA-binding XRE family transcriptional regulator